MRCLYDVPAPAKLNLFLHITGRRDDGYHLMQSVFMLIDWQDALHFSLLERPVVERQDLNADGVVLPQDDLCVRAAKALQAATGCTQGVHIALDKQIPAQAGMGGGSSDAAATLIALNRLWRLNLSRAELARIGLSLGADVPFFIHGENAWVEGIGEQIYPLRGAYALPSAEFVVVKPEQGLDTRGIFASPSLKRDTEHATIDVFTENQYGFGCNDMQLVAESLCSDVREVIDFLGAFEMHARMTGSGSAVFAHACQAFDSKVVPSNWRFRVSRNLDKHPLYYWMSD